jgi:hypothetical protein
MKKIVGVGFLMFTFKNGDLPELLTIEELKDKPEYCKKAGMISFPLETVEEEDGGFQGTIIRLLKEEVGIHLGQVIICEIIPEKFQLIPGRNDVDTVYAYGIFKGNTDPSNFKPRDNDIRFAGWKTIKELRSGFVRVEVGPVLDHFITSKHYDKLISKIKG